MMTYPKLLIATAILLTTSHQVLADDSAQDNERPPERPSFTALDVNSDGGIDLEEFSANQESVFIRIDTDQDGAISEEEFEAHKPPHPKRR